MRIFELAPPAVPIPPKTSGGTENVIHNLIQGFVSLGHDITLFATGDSQVNVPLEYVFEKALFELDLPSKYALPYVLHFDQAMNYLLEHKDNFDIVHAHLSGFADLAMLPFLVKSPLPTAVTLHSPLPRDPYSYMDGYFLKYYGDKFKFLHISKSMEAKTQGAESLGVVYNTIDTNSLPFNLNPGDYVTWLGRIVPFKGLYEAILAALRAGEKIVFAGVVDRNERESEKYFENKIKPLIDNINVVYLGPADLEIKCKMLSEAKAFINPITWEEPFGMVMAESLLCGTPVISYDRGAANEVVTNNKTGFLVEDINGIVRALKKIDTIDRAACRQDMIDRFSPEAVAKNHIKIFEELLK